MVLDVTAAARPLAGRLVPPGDKSVSHRALILASLANGVSRISGLLDAEDTRATRQALAQLGADFDADGDTLCVQGLGKRGLSAPDGPLDMGNSGTAMRLLAGVLAAQPFDSTLIGDASLSSRPMRRILRPLRLMGASIEAGPGATAPLRIKGAALRGIDYESPVASAQVKSCILLAGLYAHGETSVTEPVRSRDHTERMLPLFGARMTGPCAVTRSNLRGADIAVPADPSSAAFAVAAGLLVAGSELCLERVGLNETRTGLFRTLEEMGATLDIEPTPPLGAEPAGTLRLSFGRILRAVELPPERIPSMIDEIPVLLALAARARGVTRIRGAAELRVKESDRLAVMSRGLRRLGVEVVEYEDGVDVTGGAELRAAELDAAGDHRCAMSFAVLGLATPGGVRIRGARQINTSYPGFVNDMRYLGADMSMTDGDGSSSA